MTEADIAQGLRKRLYMLAPTVKLVAVPNAGKRTRWAVQQVRKEGLAPGFPDMCAIWPGAGIAFLELKTPAGRLSDNQAEWIERLRDYGHRVAVVRGVDEAVAFLAQCGAPVNGRPE